MLLFKKIPLSVYLFFGFFLVYVHNLSRSVYGGDVGDLVTAAAVGGVAHPPGYPLFVVLGYILVHVFPFFTPAFSVGLISATAASMGTVVLYLFVKKITDSPVAGVISSLVLGFSFLYWLYAEVAEVFALNAFFALLLFFVAYLYRTTKNVRYIVFFFFFLGLSCTHHQTIVLIFPSLFLMIAHPLWKEFRKNKKILILLTGFFLVGLLPFLYIFIASSHAPIINWDSVHDITSFFHLVLRKDYGTLQAGIFDTPSFSQRFVTVQIYVQYLLVQLTIPVVTLVFLGFFALWRNDKLFSIALFLGWLLSGPLFLMYAGFPLTGGFILGAYERFMLLSQVIFLIPFGAGLIFLATYLATFLPKRHYEVLFQVMFFFIPFMLFIYNFPKTNLSSVFLGDTYASDFLTVLPKNSVLLIAGDTEIFNTWYMHFVRNVRPDILLYNIGAAPLTNNSIGKSLAGIPASKRTEALTSLLLAMKKNRPIFSTIQFQPKTKEKITWVPYGLSYKMYVDSNDIPDKQTYVAVNASIWSAMHVPNNTKNPAYHNLTIAGIPDSYSNSLIATGAFMYSHYHDSDEALHFYQEAKNISPQNQKVYNAFGILYAAIPGKCQNVVDNLTVSLQLDALQEIPYFFLYKTYAECFHSKSKADEIAKIFHDLFQKDFQKEFQHANIR